MADINPALVENLLHFLLQHFRADKRLAINLKIA
jgi:hypothetical protein